MARSPEDEKLIRDLMHANKCQGATIRNMRKEIWGLEDELEEFLPTDFYYHKGTRYYFSHEKQMLYHDREQTHKAGKINRTTKKINWNV